MILSFIVLQRKIGFTLWLSNWRLITMLILLILEEELYACFWHCTVKPTIWSGPEPSCFHLHVYVFWQKDISAGNPTFYKNIQVITKQIFLIFCFSFSFQSISPLLSNTHLYTPIPVHTYTHLHTSFYEGEKFKHWYSLNALFFFLFFRNVQFIPLF